MIVPGGKPRVEGGLDAGRLPAGSGSRPVHSGDVYSILVDTMPRNAIPTARQRAVLDLFLERSAKGEAPPTYREIADHFGWKSATAAQGHVLALIRKGLLKASTGGSARGTSLAEPLAYRTRLVSRLGRNQSGVELAVPTYMLPEEGILFAFHQPDGRLASAGLLERDLVFVGAKTTPVRPRHYVISEGGKPVAVADTPAARRRAVGLVVASMRSQHAAALAP